jgi:pentose-5-phosphate-3-epimerase
LKAVTKLLHLTDLLLAITFDPGFGGQQYLAGWNRPGFPR